ncbi:MAG: hypothetical protein MK102_17015 [Fuerstiella sp.]|nr:hypothetical protein [Fuerstiella sp.]
MGYERSFEEPDTQSQAPCMNLRSKAIYVTGNPDPQSSEEEGSTRFNCWCNRTQHILGPDEELVDRTACVIGRECFRSRDEP